MCCCAHHNFLLTVLIESPEKSSHRWETSGIPLDQERSLSRLRFAQEIAYGSKYSYFHYFQLPLEMIFAFVEAQRIGVLRVPKQLGSLFVLFPLFLTSIFFSKVSVPFKAVVRRSRGDE